MGPPHLSFRPPPLAVSLRDPIVALLWAGQAMSAIGDQAFLVALSWVAVRVLGERAGYLTILLPAVTLVVALTAGRADRHAPRRVMIAADVLRAAALTVLAATWLARGQPPAWALVTAIVALGAGSALFRPALQAVLPPLVGRVDRLPAANALMETTDRIARLIGPASIGLLDGLLPVVHFVTLDIASFIVSASALAMSARLRPLPAPIGHHAASVLRGFRAMASHPILRFVLLTVGPVNAVWWVSMFLALPLLVGSGHDSLGTLGLVWASYGATNLATNLLMGGGISRRPGRPIFAADVILGVGLAIMGTSALLLPPGWAVAGYCAGAALGAIGGPLGDIPVAVLRQTRLAPGEQAAAMRAILVVWNIGTLIGMAAAPTLFERLGVAATVVCGGLLITIMGAAGLLMHHATPHDAAAGWRV